jgi:hypothetical protein
MKKSDGRAVLDSVPTQCKDDLMLWLFSPLKPLGRDATIVQDIARLASTEREVRTLEMLIEHISSLEEEDLARVWPRLVSAIYRPTPPSLLESRFTSDGYSSRTMTNRPR